MQSACNRAKWAHTFDSNAPSMEAQAHTSRNRRASCYMRAAAPPLAPLPRLLDCGTSTTTRGNPACDPTVPTRRIDHGPVSRGRRRDGQCGQKWAGSNGGGRRAEAAVHVVGQAHVPSRDSKGTLSHGVKTARPGSVPRTARARAIAAPRTTRPVALTLRRDRRHLWQEKRATLRLRHNDRVKKRYATSFDFISFSFSSFSLLQQGPRKGDTPKRILLREGNRPRASLQIRGSKAGPLEGFNSRLRALRFRAHYWSEVRRPAPRKGSTAASGHSGSAPTTDQGFVGWPSKGSQPPQT
jgi:hypothetical protein